MAKGRGNYGPSGFPKTRWVDITLDPADKEQLSDLVKRGKLELVDYLDQLVREGFKLSFSHDVKNACYIASLTDLPTGDRDWQAVLTARGSVPLNAWYSLAYKHFVKSSESWLSLAMERRDFGDFG